MVVYDGVLVWCFDMVFNLVFKYGVLIYWLTMVFSMVF